jgi:hypothetical protein
MSAPRGWRRKASASAEDALLTHDGVRFANAYEVFTGTRVARHLVPRLALDTHVEIFDVPAKHPAWPGRGVRALLPIAKGTPVGYYTGVCRPGSFAPDNPYVFAVQPPELDLVIDAIAMGNETRYINDPRGMGKRANLEAEDATQQCGAHCVRAILLRASRNIAVGNELLLSYEQHETGYWAAFDAQIIDLTTTTAEEEWISIKRERVDDDDKEESSSSSSSSSMGGAPTFYEAFQMLASRLAQFDPAYRDGVNMGTQASLISALQATLRDCAEQAIKEAGRDAGVSLDQLTHIPGYLEPMPSRHDALQKCIGQCGAWLPKTHEYFDYDGKRLRIGKRYFRARCRDCRSTKNPKKRTLE